MRDLHELPKLSDSLSYLYIEHAIIEQKAKAVEMVDEQGRVMIPAANLTVLLLGPGTRITHAAVKSLADNGCTIVWVGEDGTRYYAHGGGETRRAYHLLHQARLVSDPHMRLAVCRRMYRRRFGEELEPGLTIQQLRGKEGVRMRTYYAQTSLRYGVEWKGRRYKRGNWEAADPVNRALSSANALLNGLCHAAIVSGGYSAALGFIHTGKQLSFVYDIADLYKTEITIPVAFRTAAQGQRNLHARVRTACRAAFKEKRLLQCILPDIMELLDLSAETLQAGKLADTDPARPEPLWTPADEAELAPAPPPAAARMAVSTTAGIAEEVERFPARPARAEPAEVVPAALRLRRQRAEKGMSGGWTVWQLNPAAWHVITASGPPGYTIQKIKGNLYCNCPDFARTGLGACKHTFAVELFLASEASRLEEEA